LSHHRPPDLLSLPTRRSSDLAAERPMYLAPKYKDYFERAGFVDVMERRFKWPLNEWPKDSYFKEIWSVDEGEFESLGHSLRGHLDRKSTRLNSSHVSISYAVF